MTQQKLHIVHTEASQGWGGQEIRILTEAKTMQAQGHQITLLAPKAAKIHQEAEKLGLTVITMPYEKRSFKAMFATRRWLKQHQPDIVNTHSSIDSWVVAIAALGLDFMRTVRTRHISAPINVNGINRWLYQKAAQHIVTTGETLRQTIIRDLQIPAEQITSIPTGIDLQRYSLENLPNKRLRRADLGIAEDAILLGIVATLRSWKGHDDLLHALKEVIKTQANTQLLIVGDGPRREHIEQLVSELNLQNHVHLVGQRNDVEQWLALMDLFILPSYANEGVPQSLMQAMAMALPVISTRVGAIDELVADQQNGLLVEAQNPLALQQAIVQLIHDKNFCHQAGQHGRQIVQNTYALPIMVSAMERIFYHVLQER
jgi:glycosyltransferase involved in cell wall biosynthesis